MQHALIASLEKLRILDKRGYGGAILMALSKAFDTLNHDLLIAKLHADDNTLYTCNISLSDLLGKLESAAELVIDWFRYNYMKLNESKCQLLVCGNKEEVIIAKINNSSVIETHEVKLLGTLIDRNLRFKSHIQLICSKVGKKNALARLCKLLPFKKTQNSYECICDV